MNPHERSPSAAATPLATVPASHRRRWIIAIVAAIVVLSATGTFGVWYFTYCGNCDRAPILCDDPCTLPTFG